MASAGRRGRRRRAGMAIRSPAGRLAAGAVSGAHPGTALNLDMVEAVQPTASAVEAAGGEACHPAPVKKQWQRRWLVRAGAVHRPDHRSAATDTPGRVAGCAPRPAGRSATHHWRPWACGGRPAGSPPRVCVYHAMGRPGRGPWPAAGNPGRPVLSGNRRRIGFPAGLSPRDAAEGDRGLGRSPARWRSTSSSPAPMC